MSIYGQRQPRSNPAAYARKARAMLPGGFSVGYFRLGTRLHAGFPRFYLPFAFTIIHRSSLVPRPHPRERVGSGNETNTRAEDQRKTSDSVYYCKTGRPGTEASGILSGRERELTFPGVTDTCVCTYHR